MEIPIRLSGRLGISISATRLAEDFESSPHRPRATLHTYTLPHRALILS
jgi:hypothetical protein